jgi:hypothetical protein
LGLLLLLLLLLSLQSQLALSCIQLLKVPALQQLQLV